MISYWCNQNQFHSKTQTQKSNLLGERDSKRTYRKLSERAFPTKAASQLPNLHFVNEQKNALSAQVAFVCAPCKHMSRLVGKPTICIGENKGADQLRGYRKLSERAFPTKAASQLPNLHFVNEQKNALSAQVAFVCAPCKHMSRLVGKPTICIGENKDADQLRGNREADQRLCFRYSDSTIPLPLKSEISSF